MLEGLIPYITAPEKTLIEKLPLLGQLKLQVFGPLVAVGVILGWQRCLKYAKRKDMDEFLFRDYLFWMLVAAFLISHVVSVVFYFWDDWMREPILILQVWNGLSSVGGFFGAFVGMTWYLTKHKQPIIVYADATIYGLLLGWVFGRAGCALVHDHPGKVVPEGTFLAVGPWPDGTWRYDLGLLEFFFALTLMLVLYFAVDVHKKRPGWLVGVVTTAYAPFRFMLDFFRADEKARDVISTPDARYLGLTTAQWFTLAFLLAGLWLIFGRKPKPQDLQYAKDSERRAREAAAAQKDAPKAKVEDAAPAKPKTTQAATKARPDDEATRDDGPVRQLPDDEDEASAADDEEESEADDPEDSPAEGRREPKV
jgi:phosphatidylglycerol---prolipoprotein diacylglyceryl transferase